MSPAGTAMTSAPEPFRVLHVDRLVEAELAAQFVRRLRVADVEHHGRNGVAGNHA
jgi:hypothetical protein